MMVLKEKIHNKALAEGFQLFGVASLTKMETVDVLPGRGLMRPSEVMPDAKSMFVLGMVIMDEGMNVSVLNAGTSYVGNAECHSLYYEVTETRAWRIVSWLRDMGYNAVPSHDIHIKVAAHLAGLGFIGHNTQVITPEYGPRVRWISVLTNAELEPDEPFNRDLCAEQPLCQKNSRCVISCPYQAIIPGPSQGVKSGEKVIYDNCVVAHKYDKNLDNRWEKHIRRISRNGFMSCTICNLACPYGKSVDDIS
jgi:epoxyqueuosine reductase